ncbi:hypothetical protein LIER_39458 [Lithospermum erythrorhizon]|uniref:Reverse transcriptase/retrotransposon-derived protein RNase H-like domain-containing protein n=1 Tax=Lithospermum erythrorhizon TaxID=34254 RepID=A0AAV3QGQ7_LITER
MKKGTPFQWDAECSTTFQKVKDYLMSPPVIAASIQGKPLILYVVAQEESVGALLAQKNEEGKMNALNYHSRRITPNELDYSPIEKLCVDLIFAIQN